MIKNIYKKIEPILTVISGIVAIIELIKYIKYPIKTLYNVLIDLNIDFLVSVVLILGLLITIVSFIIWISKVRKPQKSLTQLVIPSLLSKENWVDSEIEYNKQLKSYNFIKLGQIVLIIGLALIVIVRILD